MSRTPASASAASEQARAGLIFGLFAYFLWGVLPIYFKRLEGISPVDIVAHRVIWSLPFLAVLVMATRGWSQIRVALRDRKTIGLLLATSVLIAINWLLYVYAVVSGHILAGSLGYYLTPLMNIVLGRFILHERLTGLQWSAVAVAAAGVAVLAAGAGTTLWISLTLCVTFATYGLLRKVAAVDSIAGLSIETAILFPLALGWILLGLGAGRPVFGSTVEQGWLLVLAGIVSTTPLLLFTAAARRLRYSTLGMLQFLAPTLQFLIAVAVYDEALTTAHAIAFGAIGRLILYKTCCCATASQRPPRPARNVGTGATCRLGERASRLACRPWPVCLHVYPASDHRVEIRECADVPTLLRGQRRSFLQAIPTGPFQATILLPFHRRSHRRRIAQSSAPAAGRRMSTPCPGQTPARA